MPNGIFWRLLKFRASPEKGDYKWRKAKSHIIHMKEVGTVKLENKNIENIGDVFKY